MPEEIKPLEEIAEDKTYIKVEYEDKGMGDVSFAWYYYGPFASSTQASHYRQKIDSIHADTEDRTNVLVYTTTGQRLQGYVDPVDIKTPDMIDREAAEASKRKAKDKQPESPYMAFPNRKNYVPL